MFALLEHDAPATPIGAGPHWDFMLELPNQDRLATWRLHQTPATADSISAARIGDHRRRYLDFEGDIGGGRGVVRQIDRGEARIITAGPDFIQMELLGRVLRGRYELIRADERWRLRRSAPISPLKT